MTAPRIRRVQAAPVDATPLPSDAGQAPERVAPDLVLDPVERRLSDRQFGVVVAGVAGAVVAVAGALVLLPRGFGLALILAFAYPVIRVLRGAWAAHQDAGPRLVIAPAHLEAGGLRFSWRDVTDVGVGPSARVRDRRDRVKVRLNRLNPVRPTDSRIRGAGLELGDQYFDFAIPPRYELGPSEIAARIEARRGAARTAPAAVREAEPRSHPRGDRRRASPRAPRDGATSPAPTPRRRTRPR